MNPSEQPARRRASGGQRVRGAAASCGRRAERIALEGGWHNVHRRSLVHRSIHAWGPIAPNPTLWRPPAACVAPTLLPRALPLEASAPGPSLAPRERPRCGDPTSFGSPASAAGGPAVTPPLHTGISTFSRCKDCTWHGRARPIQAAPYPTRPFMAPQRLHAAHERPAMPLL
jgi:hypothetical protein